MEDIVREIAAQLGVAIEQVWGLVPTYGQMITVRYSIVLVLLAIVAVAIFVPGYLIWKKSEYEYQTERGLAIMACSVFVGITFVVCLVIMLPNIVCWNLFPYESFLNMLLGR